MDISPASFERSLGRSRIRLKVLLMLSSLGEAHPRQLARACDIDCARLREILYGNPPDYSETFALVLLGLADERTTKAGRVYTITRKGRRKARQLTARARRQETVRRVLAAEREAPEVWPHPGGEPAPAVATPVVETASTSWSFLSA